MRTANTHIWRYGKVQPADPLQGIRELEQGHKCRTHNHESLLEAHTSTPCLDSVLLPLMRSVKSAKEHQRARLPAFLSVSTDSYPAVPHCESPLLRVAQPKTCDFAWMQHPYPVYVMWISREEAASVRGARDWINFSRGGKSHEWWTVPLFSDPCPGAGRSFFPLSSLLYPSMLASCGPWLLA